MNQVLGFQSASSADMVIRRQNSENKQSGSHSQEINPMSSYFDKFDILQLFGSVSKPKAISLYIIGWIACMLINAAIFTVLIPVNDPTMQKNNEILMLNNIWQISEKQKLMENQHFNMIVYSSNPLKKTVQMQGQSVSDMSLITDNQDFDTTSIMLGFDTEYDTTGIPLTSSHFTQIIKNEKQLNKSSFCVDFTFRNKEHSIQANKHVSGVPQCDLDNAKNGLLIETNQQMDLSFAELIALGLCNDEDSCALECSSHQGHTDMKSMCYDIQMSPKEVCAVVKYETKETQKSANDGHWSFVGGCYKGKNLVKYDFADNVDEIKVVVRNQEDPILKALEYSENYIPVVVQSTPEQQISRILFSIGAISLLTLSAFIMILKFNTLNKLQPRIEDANPIDISFDRSHLE